MAISQQQYRYFFSLTPTVTVGNTFEDGQTSIAAPDITGTHIIKPYFSLLWGRPNRQYSGWQNVARKFSFSLLVERSWNQAWSLTSGLELGARGYIIHSEQSNDLLVSYRNLAIPLFATHNSNQNGFWLVRKHLGAALNMASSIPRYTPALIEIKEHQTFYPTLYAGLELSNLSRSGPFCFEIAYQHSFRNVIDHRYLALDYINPVSIKSTGSHLRFGVKYFLGKKDIRKKRKEKEEIIATIAHDTRYDNLAYRNLKAPMLIQSSSKEVSICLFDDKTIDGDSIAVSYNGVMIGRDILLDKKGACFDLVLDEAKPAIIVIHALNEGTIRPNTYELRISNGKETKSVRLKSDLKNSGVVEMHYNP